MPPNPIPPKAGVINSPSSGGGGAGCGGGWVPRNPIPPRPGIMNPPSPGGGGAGGGGGCCCEPSPLIAPASTVPSIVAGGELKVICPSRLASSSASGLGGGSCSRLHCGHKLAEGSM